MKRLTLAISLLVLFTFAVQAQAPERIYPKGHRSVTLTPYLAKDGDGTAVIVCPGGSYFWLDKQGEGVEVAQWLQAHGINAFVLHYRAAGVPAFITHYRRLLPGRRYPDMLADLQQAMQHLCHNASRYGIDTTRIGLMGFSAGGHLVMSAVCYPDTTLPQPLFVAPIYPVVTMRAPFVHQRSRRALLGERRQHNAAMCDSLSLELHIPANCPPVFCINCQDDPVVDYHNALLLDTALRAKQIPHHYHLYPTGGHGFGVNPNKGSAQSRTWKDDFLQWFRQLQHTTFRP